VEDATGECIDGEGEVIGDIGEGAETLYGIETEE
jgi:hypothetical protein